MANINLETLSQKHKKKKDALIIWGLLIMAAIVFTSLISYFIDDSNVKTFKEKQDVSKDKDFKISPQQDIKESWAMSVDTRLEEQKKEFTNLRDDVKAENEKTKNEIKDIILESVATQSQKMEDFTLSMDAKINELANSVDTKVMEQQNQIEDLYLRNSMNNGTPQGNIPVVNGEIILGDDLLPKMPEQQQPLTENVLPDTPGAEQKTGSAKAVEEKVEEKPYIPVPTKSIVKMQQIDTSKNQAKVTEDKAKLEKVEKAKLMKMSGFHLMTGLTQAYMITGAYAPAFDSGEEEPLPVLLQAEGDILIANDDSQTVDKCFFIGTAKGNMNSQTADIRLVKLSCSVADGSKKIEGNISGWVIGENGIPGVQGELLHKNGAWLSKTFVAGFLQTFASAFGNTDTTDIYIGDSGNNNNNKNAKLGTSVSNNAQSAAAGGLSTVFGKLGDYYIKMAEQIFPVIEVKGGRTVNILLKGGESFTVTDFNKLDLSEINDKIDDENLLRSQLGETEYDKLRKEQTAEDASKEESMFKSIENTNSNNSFGGGNQNNAGSNNFFNQFTGGQQNSNNKGGF